MRSGPGEGVDSAAASRSRWLLPAGLAAWLIALAFVPAPAAARVLLLAPLVIVPHLLRLFPERQGIGRVPGSAVFLAALPLLAALSLPTGSIAAALTLPWLAAAAVGAVGALMHGVANLRAIVDPREYPSLGVDVALGFWFVGAISCWSSGWAWRRAFHPRSSCSPPLTFTSPALDCSGSRAWLRCPVLG